MPLVYPLYAPSIAFVSAWLDTRRYLHGNCGVVYRSAVTIQLSQAPLNRRDTARRSGNQSDTSFNAETPRAQRNAEKKTPLRTSAPSALNDACAADQIQRAGDRIMTKQNPQPQYQAVLHLRPFLLPMIPSFSLWLRLRRAASLRFLCIRHRRMV